MMPAAPAPSVIGPCKFGSMQTRLPFMGGSGIIGASNYTLGATFTTETDFDLVRLVWMNWDSVPYTVNSAAVAPSSQANDYMNPVNASGVADPTLWQIATFNNGGAAGDYPSPSGSVRLGVLPAGVDGPAARGIFNDRTPGTLFSDWIPLQSLARLDSGATLPLVFTRSFSAGLVFCADAAGACNSGGGSAFDSVANGRIVRVTATGGDIATAPTTSTSGGINSYLAPTAVQYISRRRGLCLLNVGDSLCQGFGTASTQNDYIHQAACALSTPAFPVCSTKLAYQGSSSFTFWQHAMAACQTLNPDVVFIKCESPNDGTTTATFEASLMRAFAFADWLTRRNIVPVLRTAEPFSYNPTADAVRVALNAVVRASGWLYLDVDAVLTNGLSPASLQSQYNSPTQPPHWNDAAATAVAQQQAIPLISKIMAGRPR